VPGVTCRPPDTDETPVGKAVVPGGGIERRARDFESLRGVTLAQSGPVGTHWNRALRARSWPQTRRLAPMPAHPTAPVAPW